MNALTRQETAEITDSELIEVLSSSLYPGAQVNSIKMVLGYCKATGLDPMQKPVHIVPMWDGKAKEMRDVVMPGIGLYRTQAARTGEHVGTDEPVFGPMVEYQLDGFKASVPEWCKVTVYRMVQGQRCAYTATEFWLENYATAGKDTQAPNSMWKKRSRGQLAKCAEAQALRKGFPEVGNQPTAEEMEGKMLDGGVVIDGATGEVIQGQQSGQSAPALPAYPADKFATNLPAWLKVIAEGRKTSDQIISHILTKNTLTADQEKQIRAGKPAAAPAGDAPAVTAADVLAKMEAAKNSDDLDAAASLIGAIQEIERGPLNKRYDELHAKFNPKE